MILNYYGGRSVQCRRCSRLTKETDFRFPGHFSSLLYYYYRGDCGRTVQRRNNSNDRDDETAVVAVL